MNNISEHISYIEATKSDIAIKKGIDNTPDENQLVNMILLAEKVFEPLRLFLNVPIGVTSFFRSKQLNKLVGGSINSQHMANNGSAIDIDADIFNHIKNIDIFNYIKDNLEFDQLIAEYPIDGEPQWVHVSYNSKNNRKQIFVSYKNEKNDTVYMQYDPRTFV